MKEKKIALDADGKAVDHNASIASYEVMAEEWDDWSVRSFDGDGDESMVIDEDEESTI